MNFRVLLLASLLFSVTLCSKKSNDAAAKLPPPPFSLAPAQVPTPDSNDLEQMIRRADARQDSICQRANKLHQQYEFRQNPHRVRDLDP